MLRLQDNLALIPLVSISSLTFMKKRMTLGELEQFSLVYFTHISHKCHDQPEGWGYRYIAASQPEHASLKTLTASPYASLKDANCQSLMPLKSSQRSGMLSYPNHLSFTKDHVCVLQSTGTCVCCSSSTKTRIQ